MHEAYVAALVLVNTYFLATTVANLFYLHRATSAPGSTTGPKVSVIVPARNEEESIAACLESLLRQDYEDYEIVVVDDDSTDATARIVHDFAARDSRVRLVSVTELPDGWLGKPHAMSQGAAAARGEILIFTDADTAHRPASVSWAVTNLEIHEADMVSGYLEQQYGSFGEKMIVPTMYAALLAIPLYLVGTADPRFAFAIGQYMAIRREALAGIGGFEPFKDSIVDDVSLAARVKDFGYREVFLDATAAARCHLYHGYRHAFDGIERSVYAALGGSPIAVAVISLVVLAMIVAPAISVIGSVADLQNPGIAAATPFLLFALAWGAISRDRRVPFSAFALYPVVFLNLLAILVTSMAKTGFGGGVDWKGRTVRMPRTPPPSEPETAEALGRSGGSRE